MPMDLLANELFGNPISTWLIALGVTLASWIVLRVVMRVVVSRLERLTRATTARWDDVVAFALKQTKGVVLLALSAAAGSRTVELSGDASSAIASVAFIAALVQVGVWATAAIVRWIEIQREERAAEDGAAVMTMSIVGVTARILIWAVVVLLALDNVGIDVTALVAGLGVGGIAVALAAQNILGDLFASLSIALDRPFVIKDFLVIGEFKGTVEEIGLKTTRLRSLSGEQLVFSNADLLNSRIKNFGRMFERRVAFSVGVTYQTPRSQLEAIPGLIREAIEEHGDKVRFDRSHFQAFGDSAILFETVYFVLTADYLAYMDIQQRINLRLHEEFENRDIDFAYPTQTIHLVQEETSA
ncbi:MAG: mechanosensitive ion channel family protein [Phycisphaerales bacterium]|nr:mechanosensitive ion channel family protein [Phycisphaerales bacterium]